MQDLTVARSRRTILDSLAFDLSGPGVVVVGGANGSGKSTLLRAMCGFIRPERGRVLIGSDESMQPIRHRDVRYLPQEPSFPGSFTVTEMLWYCAWLFQTPARARPQAVEAALEQANITSLRHRPVGRLSGGERRRAFVAATGINCPPILLLDEPTVGIDVSQRRVLRDQLAQLGRESLVLLVTHEAEDFLQLAQQVLVLRGGQVAYLGGLEDFLAEADQGGPRTTSVEAALVRCDTPDGVSR